ncbi:MAG: bifunctional phosphopantothenoylcysteine decarboxylase/phosphopantothenate--cysteine ligase CoaBC [Candidatus Thermoplasmatota archaeon]|nr:bifunctional phosphopantothenoylcysteine decarboxylase/phosphopantothenate--cysteine ligase CoaBC [Candidatus Thermoplasmatota archaeon]
MHPAEDIRGARSDRLKGKRIIIGITGSIAAVECVKLIRELIRHGAEVHAVMTEWAGKLVGPEAIEFATGTPVVTELTGQAEHVKFCGDVPDRADLLLVAPCTANTLGKMVCGIDDTPVTTYLTTAIGTGIPVMVVPAMHSTMYEHPVVKQNLDKARELGISIVDPVFQEKKAKMASISRIVEEVQRKLSRGLMKDRKVLIVTGATREPVDDMRLLTNRATGVTGIALGREAYREGADVLILAGENVTDIGEHTRSIRFSSVKDLLRSIEVLSNEWGTPDIAFFAAGISDYIPVRSAGKIPSGKSSFTLDLEKAPKVIDSFKRLFGDTFIVGFKAESVETEEELMKRAFKKLRKVGMGAIIANDLKDVSKDRNRVILLTPEKEAYRVEGGKSEIAVFLIEKISELRNG